MGAGNTKAAKNVETGEPGRNEQPKKGTTRRDVKPAGRKKKAGKTGAVQRPTPETTAEIEAEPDQKSIAGEKPRSATGKQLRDSASEGKQAKLEKIAYVEPEDEEKSTVSAISAEKGKPGTPDGVAPYLESDDEEHITASGGSTPAVDGKGRRPAAVVDSDDEEEPESIADAAEADDKSNASAATTPSAQEDNKSKASEQGEAEADASSDRLSTSDTSSTIRRRNKLKKITLNFSNSKNHILRDVVRNMVPELGWKSTEEDDTEWHLMWLSIPVKERDCLQLRRPQRINHFPGMHQIAHKCELAKLIDRVKAIAPQHFQFHPETFSLPMDRRAFENCIADSSEQDKTFIIKPDGGACGNGIFITQKARSVPTTLSAVAQRYLDNPMLIDGRKFDLRLYVLVTSMSPLRAYLHHEGLARFASDKYEKVTQENMKTAYMHLTNYSLNKHHPDFQVVEGCEDASSAGGGQDEGEEAVGSKRSVEWVRTWLGSNGFDVGAVWREIEEVIVKTLIAARPHVQQTYSSCIREPRDSGGFSCFEILGFDIMLDDVGKPWLIEVNQNPSWETGSPLDFQVKHAVIKEALLMVCPTEQECRLLKQRRGASPTRTVSLPAVPGAAAAEQPKLSNSARGIDLLSHRDLRATVGPSCRAPETEAEVLRHEVATIRAQQERYYARGYRRLFPVQDPADNEPMEGRPSSATSAPLEAQAAGWHFLAEQSTAQAAARAAAYAACETAAEEALSNSFWRHLGRHAAKQVSPRGRDLSPAGRGGRDASPQERGGGVILPQI